jgi:hypothetical protein
VRASLRHRFSNATVSRFAPGRCHGLARAQGLPHAGWQAVPSQNRTPPLRFRSRMDFHSVWIEARGDYLKGGPRQVSLSGKARGPKTPEHPTSRSSAKPELNHGFLKTAAFQPRPSGNGYGGRMDFGGVAGSDRPDSRFRRQHSHFFTLRSPPLFTIAAPFPGQQTVAPQQVSLFSPRRERSRTPHLATRPGPPGKIV